MGIKDPVPTDSRTATYHKYMYDTYIKGMFTMSADVQKIEMVKMAPPDALPRETKYPWRELVELGVGEGTNGFVIKCDTKEEAETLKGNITTSGFSFFERNELPFKILVRIFEVEGKFAVGAWLREKKESEG